MSVVPGGAPGVGGGVNFSPEPQYGEGATRAQLAQEAPVSGAPVANPLIPAAPAAPSAPAAPALPMPTVAGPAYYQMAAATWQALAKLKGASPVVRELARRAKQDAEKR